MTTIYKAFDGKEFDNEEDCQNYETQEKYGNPLDPCAFYNANGKRIPTRDVIDDCADTVFIAHLPTAETVQVFNDLLAIGEGYNYAPDDITQPGLYFYEDCLYKYWHEIESFPEFIANTYEIYREAKKIKEQLKNEN